MKSILKRIELIMLSGVLLLATSCSDEFFDINKDPNNPTSAALSQLLTNSQVAIAGATGLSTTGLSSHLSVFMHQTVRRGDPDRYGTLGNSFMINACWQQLYDIALQDLEVMIESAQNVPEGQVANLEYAGVGKLMKAYAYSVMVDVWGDLPYSEAHQLAEFQNPKFDDDAEIYPQLLSLIDEGISNIEASTSSEPLKPGADDLIYGGNNSRWIKFGKTLKLRMLNQLRMVSNVDDQIKGLITEGDLISSSGDDFQLMYGTSVSPDNRHNGFVIDYANQTKTYYISPWFWDVMKGNNPDIFSGISDPRVPYYFHKQLLPGEAPQNPSERLDADGFLTIHFGSNGPNQAQAQDVSQTVLGIYPVGGWYDDGSGATVTANTGTGAAPERMLTYYTVLYLQAELALDGVIDGDPRDLLQEAMQASFEKVNEVVAGTGTTQNVPTIEQDAIDEYIASVLEEFDAGDADRQLEIILTEKWIAGFGNSIDSYNDYRRKGYPAIFDPNSDTGPFALITSSPTPFLVSLPWRAEDLNLNQNAPAQKNPTMDRVFWDPN
ncbi:MAG: SusD/RagB family nutrient-binding outer membrane lipoprotein [Saprospiraceae bacterium]|nr:SusD/RagB family nutrient-binding outer membrane lipoprotein [Saprospiraceae bacterium]